MGTNVTVPRSMLSWPFVDLVKQLRDGTRAAGFVAVHGAGDEQARAGRQAVEGVAAQVGGVLGVGGSHG
jgi:hypothetical protein